MPQFTINLSGQAVTRLQAIVQRYNENIGQKLTVAQWLELHVKELVVADDLAERARELERQANERLQAEIQNAREALIASLEEVPK